MKLEGLQFTIKINSSQIFYKFLQLFLFEIGEKIFTFNQYKIERSTCEYVIQLIFQKQYQNPNKIKNVMQFYMKYIQCMPVLSTCKSIFIFIKQFVWIIIYARNYINQQKRKKERNQVRFLQTILILKIKQKKKHNNKYLSHKISKKNNKKIFATNKPSSTYLNFIKYSFKNSFSDL
ncbi:hypothetical protein ABPG74_014122 [Tetrahymena malaccensis]